MLRLGSLLYVYIKHVSLVHLDMNADDTHCLLVHE